MQHVIPLDQMEDNLHLTGNIVHMEAWSASSIKIYFTDIENATERIEHLRIFETGETIPNHYEYLDTVVVGRTAAHVCRYTESEDPWIPATMSDGVVLNVDSSEELPSLKHVLIDPSHTQ